jgi:hypothetical protein
MQLASRSQADSDSVKVQWQMPQINIPRISLISPSKSEKLRNTTMQIAETAINEKT